ncbi:Uncharacterized protein dnm_029260 [Desulfonema magnum]|uniref:Uncharacterized protein n=1 Tax=Desulfonema magnum TaxID=45655 RepID=A0A975BK65_9BACT|nr:Uncharacterized protein dnm_029260 [Desulfonema magnum]
MSAKGIKPPCPPKFKKNSGVPNLQFGNFFKAWRQRYLPNCKFGTPDKDMMFNISDLFVQEKCLNLKYKLPNRKSQIPTSIQA